MPTNDWWNPFANWKITLDADFWQRKNAVKCMHCKYAMKRKGNTWLCKYGHGHNLPEFHKCTDGVGDW